MNWESRPLLVAEDNDDDYFLLQRAIKKANLHNPVRRAKNGQEAVDYLAGTGMYEDRIEYPFPQLLLLDLKMPLMHGFDVLSWIRKQKELRSLPVVIFSSSPHTEDIRKGYEWGANGYLTKSTSVAALVEVVSAIQAYWLRFNCAPDGR
ncbi:MAG: response regulator [Candidatus Methylacidiphilales bacterium]|nr:response regulator [Candidatus Methylacidiphilales bacterium]